MQNDLRLGLCFQKDGKTQLSFSDFDLHNRVGDTIPN